MHSSGRGGDRSTKSYLNFDDEMVDCSLPFFALSQLPSSVGSDMLMQMQLSSSNMVNEVSIITQMSLYPLVPT